MNLTQTEKGELLPTTLVVAHEPDVRIQIVRIIHELRGNTRQLIFGTQEDGLDCIELLQSAGYREQVLCIFQMTGYKSNLDRYIPASGLVLATSAQRIASHTIIIGGTGNYLFDNVQFIISPAELRNLDFYPVEANS